MASIWRRKSSISRWMDHFNVPIQSLLTSKLGRYMVLLTPKWRKYLLTNNFGHLRSIFYVVPTSYKTRFEITGVDLTSQVVE